MAPAPEQTETQALGLAGAELATSPDGARFVRLAVDGHAIEAKGFFAGDSPTAAILCGPAGVAGTLNELARTLAGQGANALVVRPHPAVGVGDALASCAAFLRRHAGAKRLVLVGAGDCAGPCLESACPLDAEAVLLLAPRAYPSAPSPDLLRGRPLLVCGAGGAETVEPLAALPHAERIQFALATEGFDEVRADLLAVCMPFLARALGP